MFRKIFLFVLTLVMVNISLACTNFLITKGASKDGSTMVTYAADSYGMYGELYHWAPAVYADGTKLKIFEWDTGKYLGKIDQAAGTYNVVGNMNEWQLAISETTFGGRRELRNKKGIMDYGSLIYVTLQRAKTAREAIKIMSELVEKYGYYSSGESFSISDPNEVWIMELIGKGEGKKGAVWVAVKIPDGYVSAHANQARITTFDQDDPENVLYAKDVISFAREKGYFNGEDKDFNFSDAYAPLDFGAVRFCDARVWSFFRRINKDMDKYLAYVEGKSMKRMPLYIKPDEKLSVHDVMQLMRDHYEGTPFDMTKGVAAGTFNSPYRATPLVWKCDDEMYFHERPISTPQTAFSFVSQSRSDLPREVGGVLWFGLDDTYFTVYNPIYTCSKEVPHNYKQGLGSSAEFTWESAFWVFNFVSNYSYPIYSRVIDDVRAEQNRLEGLFVSRQKEIDQTAMALYKQAPGRAVDYLTDYSISMATKTYQNWKKLGENLILKYTDTIIKDEFLKVQRVGYSEEARKAIVEKEGDKIKMRELPVEKETTLQALNGKIKKALDKQNYKEAKKLLTRANKTAPENKAIKDKLEKVNSVLKKLEQIHKETFNN
ncbi:MAG: C69 family dipeptidase [Rhodothermaceae bacterium]